MQPFSRRAGYTQEQGQIEVAASLNLGPVSGQPLLSVWTADLQKRQTILILDKYEHLIETSAQLAGPRSFRLIIPTSTQISKLVFTQVS